MGQCFQSALGWTGIIIQYEENEEELSAICTTNAARKKFKVNSPQMFTFAHDTL
jgi:hypothetical protein